MSSINLGPYNVNKPTVDEKANIRESLGLYSASLLNATFNQNGSELTIADPTIPTNTITFDKNRLTSNIADSLSASQTFSVSGDVTTTTERSFNGTQAVNIPVTINAGVINTVKLAEGSVTASKISNGNITPEKLSAGGPVWTGNAFFTTTNTAAIGNAVAGAISLKLGNNRSGVGSSNIEFTTSTVEGAINSNIVRATDTDGAFSITNFGTGNFTLSQTGNAPIIFSTASTERMRISATGAVGIGTINPSAPLHVQGQSVENADPELTITGSTGYINFHNSLTAGSFNGIVQAGDKAIIYSNGTSGTGAFVIAPWQSNTSGIRINSTGNVGIGKTNPSTTLDVNGTVTATTFVGNLTGTASTIADAAVTPAKLSQPLTLATSQSLLQSPAVNAVSFTDIPSWVKKITIAISGAKHGDANHNIIQLGTASSFITTGYESNWGVLSAGTTASTTGINAGVQFFTLAAVNSGFGFWSNNTLDAKNIIMTLVKMSDTTWVSSHSGSMFNGTTRFVLHGGGTITLAAGTTINRLRLISSTAGTPANFTAGSINIMYE